jgi:hypothetical protein
MSSASNTAAAASNTAATTAAAASNTATEASIAEQKRATEAAIAEQKRQFDISQALQIQARDQARTDQMPWLNAGTTAVNRLANGLTPEGEFNNVPKFNFGYNQNADPGYGFRFDQGMRGLNASMAARGMGVSGANIKGAIDYGQGMGSQEYQNAFNRYTTGYNADLNAQNTLYNRVAGVAGTGGTAANQIASQGLGTASSMGAAGTNLANSISNSLISNAANTGNAYVTNAANIGNAYTTSAANTGNAAMAAAGIRNSAYGGAANLLGRMYGPSVASNPYGNAAAANLNPYNWGNVYGYGGGGTVPTTYDPNIP